MNLANDILRTYHSAEQRVQQRPLQDMQQVGTLQGILANAQKAQMQQQATAREAALLGVLSKLPPGATPEMVTQAITPYVGADTLMRTLQGSQDRAATREAANTNLQASREGRLAEIEQRGAQHLEAIQLQAKEGRITREEAAARELTTKEHMARLLATLRPGPQPRALQLTTDAQGNQLIVNPDGTTRPLTTQDGTGVTKPVSADRPMTEFQGKAALYGTRAGQSDKILKSLEEKVSLPGLAAGQAMGTVGNYILTSEQRRVDQAQRDFVNAVLRQESGAVISDAEFANAKRQYFPTPGDDAKTIAQKRANRKLAIDGFARMSGPKGAQEINTIINEPLLPGSPQESTGKTGVPKVVNFSDMK